MDAPINVWNEVRVTAEGISISLLSETGDGTAIVEDEAWFTFAELEANSPQSPISLNLSDKTQEAMTKQTYQDILEEAREGNSDEPLPEVGDVLADDNAPSWSNDEWVEVLEVLRCRADEYVIDGFHEGEVVDKRQQFNTDMTVADVNQSYPADDPVVIAQYERGGEEYAFPVSRLV